MEEDQALEKKHRPPLQGIPGGDTKLDPPPPRQLIEKPKLPAGTMPGGARSGSAACLAHLLLWNPAPQAEEHWPDLRNCVLAVEETLVLK